MKKNFIYRLFVFSIVCLAYQTYAQSLSSIEGVEGIDKEFINSLPVAVRGDILSEIQKSKDDMSDSIQKRPSSELQKLKIVQDWENFKKSQYQKTKSDRYGIKLFNTMQSSFMPLNEPNFGNNYIVDYGDFISIEIFGAAKNKKYKVEVERDGSIVLEDIGKIVVGGLNFEQATSLIKSKYESSSFGVSVIVNLEEIRDINILITGWS
jgi:Periplasmic protein involved in polysaccharide export